MSRSLLIFMRILDYEATRRLLPYQLVVQAIEQLLLELPDSKIQVPQRLHLPVANDGVLLVMPACDQRIGMTKMVTVHPNNHSQNLPSLHGDVLVFDAGTGRRLGLLDGPAVTEVRTAALSVLAAQRLASRPEGDLLIIGSGAQAAAHLAAFSEVLNTKRVFVHSRNFEKAAQFCQQHQRDFLEILPVVNIDEVIENVSLVVTATTSSTPVLPPVIVPGQFIAAVGSFRRDMQELPDEIIRHAVGKGSRLVVDTAAALTESGEFPSLMGDHSRVETLATALRSPSTDRRDELSKPGRSETERADTELATQRPAGIVVFKSVGHAMWDLAAVRVAFGTET